MKCMNDIVYFANEYCKLMTPEGIKKVSMREYQRDYLRHLSEHQLSIFLSARQSGKCLTFLSTIHIKVNKDHCQEVKKHNLENYSISEDEYVLPIFELYNLYNHSLKWKIEYRIYWKE